MKTPGSHKSNTWKRTTVEAMFVEIVPRCTENMSAGDAVQKTVEVGDSHTESWAVGQVQKAVDTADEELAHR